MNRQVYKVLLFLLITLKTFAQEQGLSIGGQVKSNADNLPLQGVSVSDKNGRSKAVTDINGNFKINAAKGNVLTFSYVGFLPQNVTIENSRSLNIILTQNAAGLNEVVVTGLVSNIKRSNLANAV